VLSEQQRSSLGRHLAERVGETIENSGLLPLFVTADHEVADWAARAGFPFVPDPDQGLDEAATIGMNWAMEAKSSWLVLHSDLPLITTNDLTPLQARLDDGQPVLAPSSDGGTSAIGGNQRVQFAYGPGSFHRHLAALSTPAVMATTGLLHDLDSANDLESVLRHPRGEWLRSVLT